MHRSSFVAWTVWEKSERKNHNHKSSAKLAMPMGFEFGTENDIRRCQLENSTINFFSLVSLPSLTKHIPNETKKKPE